MALSLGSVSRVSLQPPLPSQIREQLTINGKCLGKIRPGEYITLTARPQGASGCTGWQSTSRSSQARPLKATPPATGP